MEANDMEVASFAFHRSYHDTLKALPDGQRLALSDAIRAYAFEGKQPTFEDPMLGIVWGLMAPNIDASVRKSRSNSKRNPTREPKRETTRDAKPSPHGISRENPRGKPRGKRDGKPHGNPESIGKERIGVGVDGNPSSTEEEGSHPTAPSGTGAAAAKAAPPPLPEGWERTGVLCSHAGCDLKQLRDPQGALWCPECDAEALAMMGVALHG